MSEGIEYCERVVGIGEETPFCARAQLLLGIGYSLRADEILLQAQRQVFQRKAIDAFNRCQLDPIYESSGQAEAIFIGWYIGFSLGNLLIFTKWELCIVSSIQTWEKLLTLVYCKFVAFLIFEERYAADLFVFLLKKNI